MDLALVSSFSFQRVPFLLCEHKAGRILPFLDAPSALVQTRLTPAPSDIRREPEISDKVFLFFVRRRPTEAYYLCMSFGEMEQSVRAAAGLGRPAGEFIATRRSLLTRLKNWGDDESWKAFFDTYWRLIHSAALKSGLTEAEAEEVVQETVIAVAKKMGDFKYDPARGSFKGWLLQLTRWRIADQFRKRGGGLKPAAPSPDETARTATEERVADPASLDLDALWEQEWQHNLMGAALNRVKQEASAKQYQLFDLYVIKQWPVHDIVCALGVSEHQVYKAKSRILAMLRKEARELEKSAA
jgi:RNA polymerase sigma-70 factor (ECF subfamily)